MSRPICLIATFCVAVGLLSAYGQDKKKPSAASQPVKGPQYHLATAKTYNVQSHDHARILQKYAAADAMVPEDVVQEHVAAIRFSVAGAKKAVNKLSQAEPRNAELSKQVAQLQQRYDKVNTLLKELEGQVSKNSVKQQTVISQTQAISQQLQDNHTLYRAVDNNFYNASSNSYYDTGEGHFVD